MLLKIIASIKVNELNSSIPGRSSGLKKRSHVWKLSPSYRYHRPCRRATASDIHIPYRLSSSIQAMILMEVAQCYTRAHVCGEPSVPRPLHGMGLPMLRCHLSRSSSCLSYIPGLEDYSLLQLVERPSASCPCCQVYGKDRYLVWGRWFRSFD